MRNSQLFDWLFSKRVVVNPDIDNCIAHSLTFDFIGQRFSCQRSIILDLLYSTRILLPEFYMKIDENFYCYLIAAGGLLRAKHPPEAGSFALNCTALLHEASDFFRLRSFSLSMETSNSCKIPVLIA
jgi:hypothetical protein